MLGYVQPRQVARSSAVPQTWGACKHMLWDSYLPCTYMTGFNICMVPKFTLHLIPRKHF